MESIIYVTCNAVSRSELETALAEFGGSWDQDPTLDHGVVSAEKGTVYVNKPSEVSVEYDEEEIGELKDQLGDQPEIAVCIDFGHGDESLKMAIEIANRFVQRWGGMIDGNGVLE